MTDDVITLAPQDGPQTEFLKTAADIAFIGGAAGGGKTFICELECCRHIGIPGFSATIFRRTLPEHKKPGATWDQSYEVFPFFNGVANRHELTWTFPSGAKVKFDGLQYESSVQQYHGAQLPLIIYDQAEHFCCHPDTEVLAESGWKLLADVQVGEKVMSLGDDMAMSYQAVTDTYRGQNTDGYLINVSQRNGVKFSVTANHRIPVMDQSKKNTAWKFKRADELLTDSVIRIGDYCGGKRRERYEFKMPSGQGLGQNMNAASDISMDLWLEFLGWWFADGCTYLRKQATPQTPQVIISQTGPKAALVEDLMERMPFNWSHSGHNYVICSRQLYDEIAPFGYQVERRVPRWIFDLPPSQIAIFLEGFFLGDGYQTKSGGIHYGLCSEGLIDDLQELYLLCRKVSSKCYQRVAGRYDSWQLSVHRGNRKSFTQIRKKQIEQVRYNGAVVCITVENNHNFLMRYQGRISFTGNSRSQFEYLLSRNRTTCGIRPYIRANCNPDPDSWLRDYLSWWIDHDTGYAIPERSGVLRWVFTVGDEYYWFSSRAEALQARFELFPDAKLGDLEKIQPQSVTFISALLQDNKILMEKDPGYLTRLQSLTFSKRERLLSGNWNIRDDEEAVLEEQWIRRYTGTPQQFMEDHHILRIVQSWDNANKDKAASAYHACITLVEFPMGIAVVDAWRKKMKIPEAREMLKIKHDQWHPNIVLVEDAAAGIALSQDIAVERGDIRLQSITPRGSKFDRMVAEVPAYSTGRMWHPQDAPWLVTFESEVMRFPAGQYKDQVDALSQALKWIRENPFNAAEQAQAVGQRTFSGTPGDRAQMRGELDRFSGGPGRVNDFFSRFDQHR